MRVKIEETYLEVEYYFADEEVSLEKIRVESVYTMHGDDITELMYQYYQKIVEEIYKKMIDNGYIL